MSCTFCPSQAATQQSAPAVSIIIIFVRSSVSSPYAYSHNAVLHQLDQKIIYPHYNFKHLTGKYFEIGMKLNDFSIQLVKYCNGLKSSRFKLKNSGTRKPAHHLNLLYDRFQSALLKKSHPFSSFP